MIFQNKKSGFFRCPFLKGECLGDGCAGWRWADEFYPNEITIDHSDPKATVEPSVRPKGVPRNYEFYGADEDVNAFWSEPEESAVARRRGFCGVCGRPEFGE